MAFNASSFFAGAATVVVLLGAGFGGGLLMTGAFDEPREPNKLERRAAEAAVQMPAVEPAQPSVVTAQTAVQDKAAETPAVAAVVSQMPPPVPVQAVAPHVSVVPQSPPASVTAPASSPAVTFAVREVPREAAGNDAYGRAPDAELKKAEDTEARKLAVERRKAQRVRQAERRQKRERALEDVTEWVRNLPMENETLRYPPRYSVAN